MSPLCYHAICPFLFNLSVCEHNTCGRGLTVRITANYTSDGLMCTRKALIIKEACTLCQQPLVLAGVSEKRVAVLQTSDQSCNDYFINLLIV